MGTRNSERGTRNGREEKGRTKKAQAWILAALVAFSLQLSAFSFPASSLAEWHGSNLDFPASGASMYVADNALLELGTNKHMAWWVRLKWNSVDTTENARHILVKESAAPPSSLGAYSLYFSSDEKYVALIHNGVNFSQVITDQVFQDTNTHTLIAQYKGVADTTSGLTLWPDVSNPKAISNARFPIVDAATPLILGDYYPGAIYSKNRNKIYEFGVAFSDTEIIPSSLSVATLWHTNPTANPLPFDPAGVSRCFVWNEAGLQQVLVNGKWAGSEYATAGNVVYAGVTVAASNTPQGAFILNTSDATANAGWASVQASRLTLTDAAGKKAHGYIGPAGTGETLGSEKITSWTNYATGPYGSFTSAGKNITSAQVSINLASGKSYSNALNLTLNKLYKYNQTFTSTHNASVAVATGPGVVTFNGSVYTGMTPYASSPYTGATPFFQDYFTATANDAYLNTSMTAWAATVPDTLTLEPSIKEVVTPPSTGCSIYSTTNFAENSWATVESGFDWNSASYTIQITPPPFDLASGTGKPTYNLWKPVSLVDRAKGWWRHWRTGLVP